MEPPSAPGHRGHVPWHRLLLAGSLLTFWNLPTTAQITIESVPFNAVEGTSVLLLVHNVTENILDYCWYKGERVETNQLIASCRVDAQANTPGPAQSSQETIYPNGSLLFQKVAQSDTGNYYTLLATKRDNQTESVTGQLPVLPRPVITSNNPNLVEHKDTVVLTCEPETQHTTYRWWINNQSLPSSTRLDLSKDNRTLALVSIKRNDAGPYECETQNPGSAACSDPFTLNVIRTPTFSPSDSYDHPEGLKVTAALRSWAPPSEPLECGFLRTFLISSLLACPLLNCIGGERRSLPPAWKREPPCPIF
uniref:Ig-like domain-containing protein n=1 Tax=Sus scrofa TaxID=9823 RepID=A0A4X1W4S7_PIG